MHLMGFYGPLNYCYAFMSQFSFNKVSGKLLYFLNSLCWLRTANFLFLLDSVKLAF